MNGILQVFSEPDAFKPRFKWRIVLVNNTSPWYFEKRPVISIDEWFTTMDSAELNGLLVAAELGLALEGKTEIHLTEKPPVNRGRKPSKKVIKSTRKTPIGYHAVKRVRKSA